MKSKNTTIERFDLTSYLLDKVYGYMSDEDISHWCEADAEDVASDLKHDGIEADAQEVYGTIAEFITQDREEEQL